MFDTAEPTPEYLLSDFQRKVEAEVRRVLKTPAFLPSEFLGFIGPYVEGQAIQVPFSQVVGQTLVADHVDQLGGNVHGRVGQVRVGSASPFDFVQVTYDGVSEAWTTNPIFVGGLASGVVNGAGDGHSYVYGATATAYSSPARLETENHVDLGQVKIMYPVGGGFLHAPFTDAGLKAQVRYYAALQTSSNSVITTLGFCDGDIDGAVSSFNSNSSFELTFTSATTTLKTSGWKDLGSGLTSSPKDLVFVQFAERIPSGSPTIDLEWVSIYVCRGCSTT